jgi:hypothetical protein
MMARANLVGLITAFVVLCACNTQAHAISVEVARACDALVAKTFPPRQIGNPAAGSAKGTGKDQREFFNKCVANGGKMDAEPAKDTK